MQRDLAGYRSNSIAVNFITGKILILFSFKMRIFKPTLKTSLSHQQFSIA